MIVLCLFKNIIYILHNENDNFLQETVFIPGKITHPQLLQESGKFRKGQSGNPKGKAKGTRNKATLTVENLFNGELENICRKLIEEALLGNIKAIKMILDRVFPFRKDYPIIIELPKIQNSSDILQAISLITTAVGNGKISPSEGEALSRIIDVHVKAIEIHDYEKRLEKLEERKSQ